MKRKQYPKRPITSKEIERLLGDAARISKEIEQYTKDCILAENPEFMAKYKNKWVVIFKGKVKVVAPTLDKAMQKVDIMNLPRSSVVVRYFDEDPKPKIFFHG